MNINLGSQTNMLFANCTKPRQANDRFESVNKVQDKMLLSEEMQFKTRDSLKESVSSVDIYKRMNQMADLTKEAGEISSDKEESQKTNSTIVVNPDGSRALVVTTKIGSMETTMSIEISKPTDLQNSKGETQEENVSNMAQDLETVEGGSAD